MEKISPIPFQWNFIGKLVRNRAYVTVVHLETVSPQFYSVRFRAWYTRVSTVQSKIIVSDTLLL